MARGKGRRAHVKGYTGREHPMEWQICNDERGGEGAHIGDHGKGSTPQC